MHRSSRFFSNACAFTLAQSLVPLSAFIVFSSVQLIDENTSTSNQTFDLSRFRARSHTNMEQYSYQRWQGPPNRGGRRGFRGGYGYGSGQNTYRQPAAPIHQQQEPVPNHEYRSASAPSPPTYQSTISQPVQAAIPSTPPTGPAASPRSEEPAQLSDSSNSPATSFDATRPPHSFKLPPAPATMYGDARSLNSSNPPIGLAAMYGRFNLSSRPTTLPIASRRHQPLKQLDEVAAAKNSEKWEHHIDDGLALSQGTPKSELSASEHREMEEEKSTGLRHNVSSSGEIDRSTFKERLAQRIKAEKDVHAQISGLNLLARYQHLHC